VQRATLAVLAQIPLFHRVGPADRERLTSVAWLRDYDRGDHVFHEGDPSDTFFVVVSGRVKVYKHGPDGHDVILEMFGPGGPLGAVATYESRPYPASASPVEPSTCLLIPRESFFELLERHPSLVRGLLGSLSLRLVELTTRLTELTGGRIESRFARLFLKLADQLGQRRQAGVFIPLALTRQELADLIGTTIETAIRVMSRWHKDDVLTTEKDGFVLVNRRALEELAQS
jgi:CRP-like cAMP-binding protein